ncbi:DUF1338 family protein [Paraburkholderia bengalensis]|uniref:DUF1338 family protein n=1 Tax=Paraburkholderia bengalensis TaxID=2747562 RepID=A0ABU8INM5_9BURK
MKKSFARCLGIANRNIERLLVYAIGPVKAERALQTIDFPSFLNDWESGSITRSELAMALQVVLFDDLLMDSIEGRSALLELVKKGKRIFLHHSCLHTVRARLNGALPLRETAITRIIGSLGYRFEGTAELDGMGVMKQMYSHADQPEALPGFLIGELLPDRFSSAFQRVVTRVVASSADPITPLCVQHLCELEREGVLPLGIAEHVLLLIVGAFRRRHQIASDRDYGLLALESVEMEFVARTGNAVSSFVGSVTEVDGKLGGSFAPSMCGNNSRCAFTRHKSFVSALFDDKV